MFLGNYPQPITISDNCCKQLASGQLLPRIIAPPPPQSYASEELSLEQFSPKT